MRRLLLTSLIAALAALPAPSASAQTPPPAPVTVPDQETLYQDGHGGRRLMDGDWYYRPDPGNDGIGRFERQRGIAGWARVQVPHAFNATDLSDASHRGAVGWYRKDFRAPRAGRGTTWKLRFESVNYRARVYLNGREIGRHEGGYIPFELAARGLRPGVNRLVVRADSRRTFSDLPQARDQANGSPGGGWWNYGGMLREVYLRPVGGVDIAELLARPKLPCRRCDATVLLRARLENVTGGKRRAVVRIQTGDIRARLGPIDIPAGAIREVSTVVRLPSPRLWEPGSPDLYGLRATATVKRRVASTYVTHFGVRSLKVNRRGRLLINGRKVRLRGASIHEDHPGLGAALGTAERQKLFTELLALGATITRAHYPLHPQFLEIADRAGVLIWGQIPFYQVRNEALKLKLVRDKGLTQLETLIRRDQNHASALTWSIANELASRPTSAQQRYIADAVRLAKQLDPTRLTAIDFAGYPSVDQAPIYRRLDAIGVNSYFGWYPGPNGQIVDRDTLGTYLDQLHDYYPTEALFVTEFGAEANRAGPIDEKGTYAYQREFMQFHITNYDRKPYLNGAIAWILQDFRVRPGWDGGNPKPQAPVNFKGLLTETGERKPAFEDTARLYRGIEPLE